MKPTSDTSTRPSPRRAGAAWVLATVVGCALVAPSTASAGTIPCTPTEQQIIQINVVDAPAGSATAVDPDLDITLTVSWSLNSSPAGVNLEVTVDEGNALIESVNAGYLKESGDGVATLAITPPGPSVNGLAPTTGLPPTAVYLFAVFVLTCAQQTSTTTPAPSTTTPAPAATTIVGGRDGSSGPGLPATGSENSVLWMSAAVLGIGCGVSLLVRRRPPGA